MVTSPTRIGRCSATAVPTPLADAQSKSPHHLLRIADRVGNPQVALSLVHQIDGEDRKRRHPRDQLWDLLEQLVQVKDGCDFAAKIEECGQQLVVRAAGLLSEVESDGADGVVIESWFSSDRTCSA